MTTEKGRIGIIGSGQVGGSWAMVFASAGHPVSLYDIVPGRVAETLEEVRKQLVGLDTEKLMRGNLSVDEQLNLITDSTTLPDAVKGAVLVLECVPEDEQMKKKVFKELDDLLDRETILASCTSSLKPSVLSEDLDNRGRVLAVHPMHSPYHLPLVEIVPAPWTEGWVTQTVKEIMQDLGQMPVTLSREVDGFSVNRIQHAVLNEIFYQVKEGFLRVEDVEKVITEGLGMRYAFMGPLEAAHINGYGFKNFCERYSHVIYDTSVTFRTPYPFAPSCQELVEEQMNLLSPLEELPERRALRDLTLMKLAQIKRELTRETLS